MMHPSDSHSQSYAETYSRSKNLPQSLPLSHSSKALLTDRGTYLSYLETQLDLVSQALLTHDTHASTVNSLESRSASLEDRVDNVAKVTRLSQSFAERWQEESKEASQRLSERLAALEGMVGAASAGTSKADATGGVVATLTEHVAHVEQIRLEERGRADKALAEMAQENADTRKMSEEARASVEALEARFTELLRKQGAAHREEVDKMREGFTQGLEAQKSAHELAVSEQAAETARLRHELSLAENRLLSALAKQASVAQEQIQGLNETVQVSGEAERREPVRGGSGQNRGARAKRARRRGRCCYPFFVGERERSEQEEEGAAAIRFSWVSASKASKKKRALLLSFFVGSLEGEGAAGIRLS
jgi:hypothetical protein